MATRATTRRLIYSATMLDADRARAVLKAALNVRLLDNVIGQYEGDFLVVRKGRIERLTIAQILAMQSEYFLSTFGD